MNINNKIFYTYFAVLFLWVLPFLFYQDFYRDDYTRVVSGYAGWENAGRPVASILYYLLSMNIGEIYNLYPLPLFLSIFILSFSFYKLHLNIKNKYSFPNLVLIPSILLISCNPLFIQNIAYQYDVLPMSISLSFCILAFIQCNYNKSDFIYSTLLIFIALSLYQPTINVFISLCLINFTFPILISKTKYKIIYSQAISCMVAVIIYYTLIFIVSPIKPIRSELISLSKIPEHFIKNISNLYSLLSSFYTGYIFIFISLIFYILWICFSIKNNKYISIFIPVLLFIFILGPLSLLKEDMLYPRVYVTVGLLLGISSLMIYSMFKYYTAVIYSFIIFSYFILISFCYVQHQQFLFEKKVITQTINQISNNKKLYSTLMIFSYGNMPISPNTSYIKEKIPYLSIIQKPSYRWETRFKMAILGFDYTNSMYTYTIADNIEEWSKICEKGTDDVFSLKIKTNYSDVYYDKNKKYTSIWFRNNNNSICDNKPLTFDAE